jgi:hypothetical protein
MYFVYVYFAQPKSIPKIKIVVRSAILRRRNNCAPIYVSRLKRSKPASHGLDELQSKAWHGEAMRQWWRMRGVFGTLQPCYFLDRLLDKKIYSFLLDINWL